jgi:hydrogenase-4 component B
VPLFSLSVIHGALAIFIVTAAWWLWRRAHREGLTRAVTWDCGYVAPTPRMQYTASSFAGIITEWFSWILRPARHVARPETNFPSRASYAVHTPETVLEMVVEPLARLVLRGSFLARRLQHGRVQAYILYVLAGLAALAALVLWGGGE